MRIRNNQLGFSAIELTILLFVIAVLGVVGYVTYGRENNKTESNGATTITAQTTGSPATAYDVVSAPNVNSTSDLDKALNSLDQTDPSGSNNTDASQLDSQLANF